MRLVTGASLGALSLPLQGRIARPVTGRILVGRARVPGEHRDSPHRGDALHNEDGQMEAGTLTLGNPMGEIRNRVLIAGPGLIVALAPLAQTTCSLHCHPHSNESSSTVPRTRTSGSCPGDDPESHESQVPVHELQVAVPNRAPSWAPEPGGWAAAGWAHLVADGF